MLGTSGRGTPGPHPQGSGEPAKSAEADHGVQFGGALLPHPLKHFSQSTGQAARLSEPLLFLFPQTDGTTVPTKACRLPWLGGIAKVSVLGPHAVAVERGTVGPTREQPLQVPEPNSMQAVVVANLWAFPYWPLIGPRRDHHFSIKSACQDTMRVCW